MGDGTVLIPDGFRDQSICNRWDRQALSTLRRSQCCQSNFSNFAKHSKTPGQCYFEKSLVWVIKESRRTQSWSAPCLIRKRYSTITKEHLRAAAALMDVLIKLEIAVHNKGYGPEQCYSETLLDPQPSTKGLSNPCIQLSITARAILCLRVATTPIIYQSPTNTARETTSQRDLSPPCIISIHVLLKGKPPFGPGACIRWSAASMVSWTDVSLICMVGAPYW